MDDQQPGQGTAYWRGRVTALEKELSDTKGTRGGGVGTIILGAAILAVMWVITQFAHIIFIWGWIIGGLLVLGGLVMLLVGDDKDKVQKLTGELDEARRQLRASQSASNQTH